MKYRDVFWDLVFVLLGEAECDEIAQGALGRVDFFHHEYASCE